MRTFLRKTPRTVYWLALTLVCAAIGAVGQVSPAKAPTPIDLPTALRLAGARNLDVQIARERLNEARAIWRSSIEQFLPSVSPGVTYHRRSGMAQAVPAGTVTDTRFDTYTAGGTLTAQLGLGEAIYQSLAAKQLIRASDGGLEAQRAETLLNVAQTYFDLVKAQALARVASEAVDTSAEYQKQLHEAVAAGIAFRGDELRIQTQAESYRMTVSQLREQQRSVAVSLAQLLHLDLTVELVPHEFDLVPLSIFSTNAALDALVQHALLSRPELKESHALIAASKHSKDAAIYGPLIPSVGAQIFAGGLGGGPDHGSSDFGRSDDYLLSLIWRIGPGGLFDLNRRDSSQARLNIQELQDTKLQDAVIGQVVTSLRRVQALREQIELAERKQSVANDTLKLTQERKQFGVGIVLEYLQAQQELTKAKAEYLGTIADYNKAQYTLVRAVGSSDFIPPANASTPSTNATSNPVPGSK